MEVKLMPQAEEDLAYWKSTGNQRIMKRITKLLDDILLHPFTGIGKPEPLKGRLSGWWSVRIDEANRLVFKIDDGLLALLENCRQLLSDEPLFLFLTCHTPGYTPIVLGHLVSQVLGKGHIETGEMYIEAPLALPSGSFAAWRGAGVAWVLPPPFGHRELPQAMRAL